MDRNNISQHLGAMDVLRPKRMLFRDRVDDESSNTNVATHKHAARDLRRKLLYLLRFLRLPYDLDFSFGSIEIYRFFCCSGELFVRKFFFVESIL